MRESFGCIEEMGEAGTAVGPSSFKAAVWHLKELTFYKYTNYFILIFEGTCQRARLLNSPPPLVVIKQHASVQILQLNGPIFDPNPHSFYPFSQRPTV